MLGLLLKDIYNIRKQAVWYLAMTVLFCVLSVASKNIAFTSALGILVTVSMPLTAIAYEERDGWQKFVVASGTKAGAIVGEKYLLGTAFALVSIIAYAVAFMFADVAENAAAEFVTPVCMQFVVLALVLPMVFRFGVERARVYMIVAVVVLMAAFIAVMPLLGKMPFDGGLVFAVCAAVVTVAAVCISLAVSVRIYKSKEF